jgi:hypothetical protein
MLSAKIPYSFLSDFGHLTWAEVEFGLAHSYIAPGTVIDYATDKIANESEPDPEELTIAASSKEDSILERVRKIAARDVHADQVDVKAKWLCVLLAWLYENRLAFDDPLSLVEELYVEFDYPRELAPFVRYMPSDEPSLGSKEQNEDRLITRLGEFVAKRKEQMRTSSG